MPSQYHQPEDRVYDHRWMDHHDRLQFHGLGRNDLVFLESAADSRTGESAARIWAIARVRPGSDHTLTPVMEERAGAHECRPFSSPDAGRPSREQYRRAPSQAKLRLSLSHTP
jgi:hypothetical protein